MNHFTKNLITKGWLNISVLFKGFILPYFRYEIRKRGGGSLASGYKEENLIRDLKKLKIDEVDVIKVYINWDKKIKKYDKKIYVELIKNKIGVKLLENKLSKFKIDVKIIK